MKSKTEQIGIHVMALLLGRVGMLTMYPFLTAFFLAAYIEGMGSGSVFVALLLGLCSTLQFPAVIKYSITIVGVMLLLELVQERHMTQKRGFVAFVGAIISLISAVATLYVQGQLWTNPYLPMLEAFIVFSATIVFQMALHAIRTSPWDLFSKNVYCISVMSLFVALLFGLPVTANGTFSLLGLVAFSSVLYGGYCYGMTFGISLGAICGIVMALQYSEIMLLGAFVIIGLVVGIARETGKMASLIGAVLAYGFLGLLYSEALFAVEQLRAFASALVAFILTPKGVLYQPTLHVTEQEKAPLQQTMLESYRQRMSDLGNAFVELSGNFMEYNGRKSFPVEADNAYHERMLKEREVMLGQISSLGEMLEQYAANMQPETPLSKSQENRIKVALWEKQIAVGKLAMFYTPEGKSRIYMYARNTKGTVITAKETARIVGTVLQKHLRVTDEGRSIVGRDESLLVFEEAPNFSYQTGFISSKKHGEALCGDSSYMSPVSMEKMLLMISDGMGSGEDAFRQSEFLTDSMVELISAGVDQKRAVGLLNALMSLKYQGEKFATLDFCSVDLYSGVAEFVKYGAAATFIKRDNWIETIQSTSLPLGAVAETEADVTVKKLFHKDAVFLCSDGLLDLVQGEDKIAGMKEHIDALKEEEPERMAAELYKRIVRESVEEKRDDATLLVFLLKAA